MPLAAEAPRPARPVEEVAAALPVAANAGAIAAARTVAPPRPAPGSAPPVTPVSLPLPPRQPPPPPEPLEQARPVASFALLRDWPGEDPFAVLPALRATCGAMTNPERNLGGAGDLAQLAGTAAAWGRACADLAQLEERMPLPPVPPPPRRRGPPGRVSPRDLANHEAMRAFILRAYLERRFRPFELGTGTMTGYFEPLLRGAEYPTGEFQVPLLAAPPPGTRMPDRAAIEEGALGRAAPPLVWVDDPVDAYFLHIQGSGRVRLHDGRLLRLGYAAQNGHPFRSLGRQLVERGALNLEGLSMQGLRSWLAAAPPGEAAAALRANPSFIFFRVVERLREDEGPIGALGVPLTAGRSLAVDTGQVPLGSLVFARTRDPVTGRPIRRLMAAQDTGGAIRGLARSDFFWGWGREAALKAGGMKELAELVALVPREALRAPGGSPP